MPGAPAAAEEAVASEAQTSEDAEADVRERGRRVRVSREEPAPVSPPDTTAVRETSEYVFVRRDGTVFFAVAYAWENGTLRYVTSEGLRRSATRDSLDLNATQQFNEQRGLNFRLPV
jgi:predicted Zn-dependent protease